MAYLKAQGAFAIRLAPPVRANMWSAAGIKDGITDPGIKRLTEMPSDQADSAGARVISQLMDSGWLLQSPEDDFGAGNLNSPTRSRYAIVTEQSRPRMICSAA